MTDEIVKLSAECFELVERIELVERARMQLSQQLAEKRVRLAQLREAIQRDGTPVPAEEVKDEPGRLG